MIIVRLQFEGRLSEVALSYKHLYDELHKNAQVPSAFLRSQDLAEIPPLPCTLFLALLFLLRLGGFGAFAQGYLRQLLWYIRMQMLGP